MIVDVEDSVSQYLAGVLNPTELRAVIDGIVRVAGAVPNFDTVAFCGMSGALVAPSVAMEMKKGLLLIRKKADLSSSNSCARLEGCINTKSYIIVDDQVDTGNTMKWLFESMRLLPDAKCAAIILYSQLNVDVVAEMIAGVPVYCVEPPASRCAKDGWKRLVEWAEKRKVVESKRG